MPRCFFATRTQKANIGRLALEAMGYEGARYLRLLRPQKKEEED